MNTTKAPKTVIGTVDLAGIVAASAANAAESGNSNLFLDLYKKAIEAKDRLVDEVTSLKTTLANRTASDDDTFVMTVTSDSYDREVDVTIRGEKEAAKFLIGYEKDLRKEIEKGVTDKLAKLEALEKEVAMLTAEKSALEEVNRKELNAAELKAETKYEEMLTAKEAEIKALTTKNEMAIEELKLDYLKDISNAKLAYKANENKLKDKINELKEANENLREGKRFETIRLEAAYYREKAATWLGRIFLGKYCKA